jgi:XRE family transcriptional regulator, regulator of sulfur utilization
MAARKQGSETRKLPPPADESGPSHPNAGSAPPRPTVATSSGDDIGAAQVARRVSDGLRRFRKARGLSLDELAQRSGVSRAALSQIEGARTNPTLAVLWKIAVGLEVPFQVLMGVTEEQGPRVLRAGDAPPLRSADGRMESRLLSPGGAAPDLEVYELKFWPKGVHKSEPHGQGTTETVVVLTGSLRLSVGDTTHDLSAGDTIFFRADQAHAYENRSSHESRCIDVIRYARDH